MSYIHLCNTECLSDPFLLHGVTLSQIWRGEERNTVGEAAAQHAWLNTAGSNTGKGLGLLRSRALLPSLLLADGVTLYVSPVPQFHHL